jgi:23S rRNA pseudouridine1911/1915/1917 synthase
MPDVSTEFQTTERRRPQPEDVPLTVLYEDEWIIVLDKPPGVVVHPTYKNWSGTLLNGVLWRMRDRPDIQPGILTRLDKHTSGLVVIALTPEVHATMQRDAGAGRVCKQYLAVVRGVPDPAIGRIVLPLGRDATDRRLVVVRPDGAACETRYEVMTRIRDGCSLVRCELITGRTHQIRVHLASSGWPIVGDATYGHGDSTMTRQALHAWRASLSHPITRAPLSFEAPIPEDISRLIA